MSPRSRLTPEQRRRENELRSMLTRVGRMYIVVGVVDGVRVLKEVVVAQSATAARAQGRALLDQRGFNGKAAAVSCVRVLPKQVSATAADDGRP